MFELFDQFLYLAIFMFGAYITLYIKSRSYSGILLIACSILSNILIFSVVLDPFIFITLPITAVLLIADFVEDYKQGIVSRKHKIGAMIATVIIAYDIIFVIQLSNFNLANSYNLFTVGSIIGTITGFYLVIYPFKEMMQEREQNLQTTNQENLALDAKQEQIEVGTRSDNLIDILTEEVSTTDSHLKRLESNNNSKQTSTSKKLLGIDSLYFIVGAIVLLILGASIIYDFATRTVLDMEDYVFVTVDPDAVHDAKVSYYASFENFDKNNFYDELLSEAEEYGLSDTEIEKYTPQYTSENAEMFKKLDIKVANDKETVNNGDVVTTNITYNEKYAMKHNIVLKNTNFETEIDSLPKPIENTKKVDKKQLIELSTTAISNSKYGDKYNLDNLIDSSWLEEEGEYPQYLLTFGDQDPGLLGLKDDTVMFKVTPYTRGGTLYVDTDVSIFDQSKLK